MKMMASSILLSSIPVIILLALAKILGASEYGRYSLIFAFSLPLSTLCGEWARTAISRFGGARQSRVRRLVLSHFRSITLWIAASLAFVGIAGAIAGGMFFKMPVSELGIFAVTCMMASSNVVGDNVNAVIRFGCSDRLYIRYIATRSLVSGSTAIALALSSGSGVWAAAGFSLAVMLVALLYGRKNWNHLPVGRFGSAMRFGLPGWAMAGGAISSTAAFAVVRSAIGITSTPAVAGAIFLAMDLAGRGLAVLGMAFNAWAARRLYDASHANNEQLRDAVVRRSTVGFLCLWMLAGVPGVSIAAVVPLFYLGEREYLNQSLVLVLNLAALLVITSRTYLMDTIANAEKAYSIVVVCSLSLLGVVMFTYVVEACRPYVMLSGALATYVAYFCMTLRPSRPNLPLAGAAGFAPGILGFVILYALLGVVKFEIP